MVELTDVTKAYGSFTAVRNLSFSVKQGEVFGLLGENGAGKTTTLRMITTLIAPTSGCISVMGFSVMSEGHRVRQSIGVVAGETSVYDRLTVQENLELFGQLYHVEMAVLRPRIDSILERLSLGMYRRKLAGQLSKGNKQKLSIGRALLHEPRVVVMDEPMTGLDVGAQQAVRVLIEELKREGKTILFSSHHMADVDRLCDRVGIISQGRLVAHGDLDFLLAERQAQTLEQLVLSLPEVGVGGE